MRDRLGAAGVHPDAVTVAAVPVQLAMAIALVAGIRHPWAWLTVVPLAVVLMAVNALDGSLARATRTHSVRGAVLNELVDRGGDLIILGAGFLVVPTAIAFAAFASVAVSELAALVGWASTGERTFAGPMGKPDRDAAVAVGASTAVFWAPSLAASFLVIAVGASVGATVRIRQALARAGAIDREQRR